MEQLETVDLSDKVDTDRQQGPEFAPRVLLCAPQDTVDRAVGNFQANITKVGDPEWDVAWVAAGETDIHALIEGAVSGDVAVLWVDARHGLTVLVRRQCLILDQTGLRHLVLAVGHLDKVDDPVLTFSEIRNAFQDFCGPLEGISAEAVAVAASDKADPEEMAWYRGPDLSEYIRSLSLPTLAENAPLRMWIGQVGSGETGGRQASGTVLSGALETGTGVAIAPSGATARVIRLTLAGNNVERVVAGQNVSLVLDSDTDLIPGDMVVAPDARPEVSDQFAASLVWLSRDELMPGRTYFLKSGPNKVTATISTLKHKIDTDSLEHIAARSLGYNDIGFCNFSLSEPIAFDNHRDDRRTGRFELMDRLTGELAAVGFIEFGLRRATNIHWQAHDVDKSARSGLKIHKPAVLWFTGLSGSGKSTIANDLEKLLFARKCHTFLLDGDNVRHGLNRDLGFTDADRVENIRRIGEVAKLFVDAGIIVLVSFISPFRSERRAAREMLGDDAFLEIFVDTPIEECKIRDPKGLYKKAAAGEIKNFTGIDSSYEVPEYADIHLKTVDHASADLASRIIDDLIERGVLAE